MAEPVENRLRRRHFTVPEYHRMAETGILGEDDRVELIDGEIIEMPPIGSFHGGTVKRLNRLLGPAVGDLAVVAVQDPVILDEGSEPAPDVALLRPRADFYTDAHPGPRDVLLVIEVADRSLQTDRDVKVPLYARHAIPEVWLVDVAHRQVLRFTSPVGGVYQQRGVIDPTRPSPIPGLGGVAVDLSALFQANAGLS